MRVIESQTRTEVTTRDVTVRVECDLCHRVAPRPNSYDEPWAAGSYDVEEVTVSREHGHRYPEGGYTETESFDVCPSCWVTVVVPFFAEKGATPRAGESDY